MDGSVRFCGLTFTVCRFPFPVCAFGAALHTYRGVGFVLRTTSPFCQHPQLTLALLPVHIFFADVNNDGYPDPMTANEEQKTKNEWANGPVLIWYR